MIADGIWITFEFAHIFPGHKQTSCFTKQESIANKGKESRRESYQSDMVINDCLFWKKKYVISYGAGAIKNSIKHLCVSTKLLEVLSINDFPFLVAITFLLEVGEMDKPYLEYLVNN